MDSQFSPVEPKKDTTITHKRHIERGVLSKAIYMVTNLFAEDEPLKVALRTEAVHLLAHSGTYQTSRLKDMLRLSGDIGIVSETNTKILLEAVDALQEMKSSEKEIIIGDLYSEKDLVSQGVNNGVSEVTQPAHEKPVDMVEQKYTEESQGRILESKAQKAIPYKQPISSVTALDIGARRKKILEVVRSKGQATIHEFIQSIQGCSSKTIQRELTSLVLSGTLKKTGERRWSKYSLR